MAEASQHVAQAMKNEQFFERAGAFSGTPRENTDWEVVVLFYAALHYVDAVFAMAGIHPRSHRVRNQLIATRPNVAEVYVDYMELYDRSQDARYEIIQFSESDVATLDIQSFTPVKALARRLLSLS